MQVKFFSQALRKKKKTKRLCMLNLKKFKNHLTIIINKNKNYKPNFVIYFSLKKRWKILIII